MTREPEYVRAVLFMSADRPVLEEETAGLIGRTVRVPLHGADLTGGTITDVRIDADGNRLQLVTEAGGRCCRVCGTIYHGELLPQLRCLVDVRQAQAPGEAEPEATIGLPSWALVCADRQDCEQRWRSGDQRGQG